MDNNFTWLESIALKADHEYDLQNVLSNQPTEIQKAYKDNDQEALKSYFGGNEKCACKTRVFQYNNLV